MTTWCSEGHRIPDELVADAYGLAKRKSCGCPAKVCSRCNGLGGLAFDRTGGMIVGCPDCDETGVTP